MIKRQFDIDAEQVIQRYNCGIRLVLPKNCSALASHTTVQDMLDMPFLVYFLQADSTISVVNDALAATYNLLSTDDLLGKSASHISDKNCAEKMMHNDRLVIQSEKSIIKEEFCTRLDDDFSFQAIAFKFPMYNAENKVIGIFGCSTITQGTNGGISLPDSLTVLTETGLLTGGRKNPYEELLSNPLFSKRENEVLYYLAQGKTAKQIASILKLSYRTVEHHIEKMKIKSHCNTRQELIDKAISLIRNH